MGNEGIDYVQLIYDKIGYRFNNKNLIEQAFVRRSFSNENGGENNEVLEFIGDVVLSYYVTKILCDEYGKLMSEISNDYDWNDFFINVDEGDLTQIRKQFVEGKFLAKRIDALNLQLNKSLIMGKGDKKNHAYKQASVKEGVFEAILGALAIDSKWNSQILEIAVGELLDIYSHFGENGISEDDNYVGQIQSWYQKRYSRNPEYNIYPSGYSSNSGYTGTLPLIVGNRQKTFQQNGRSYGEVRAKLAKEAYYYLDEIGELFTVWDEIGMDDLTRENAVNKLQELYQKGYCSEPEYEISDEAIYEDGNIWWECKCTVRDCTVEVPEKYIFSPYTNSYYCKSNLLRKMSPTHSFSGEILGSSKKYAKKCAAYRVLCKIFDIEEEED